MQILNNKLPNKNQLCELLYTTSLYQRATSPAFNEAILQCSNQIQQKYKNLNEFIAIQDELETNSISTTVYSDANLNMYKLLSALQSLYKQISRSSFDKTLIIPLLEFEQTLLTKDNSSSQNLFPPIYKDILYRFNNRYFLPIIQTATSSLSQTDKNQISYLIQQINNGNTVLGHVGLEKQVTTLELIGEKTHSAAEVIPEQTYQISSLLPQLFQDPRLKIGKYTVAPNEQTVEINANIISTAITNAINTDLVAKFTLHIEKREMLYVDSFSFPNDPEFTAYLQALLQEKTSFSQFLKAIDDQISFFSILESEEKMTLCEKLYDNNTLEKYLQHCTDQEIIMDKTGVYYTFEVENEILKTFSISDKTLEEEIQGKFANTTISKKNTP